MMPELVAPMVLLMDEMTVEKKDFQKAYWMVASLVQKLDEYKVAYKMEETEQASSLSKVAEKVVLDYVALVEVPNSVLDSSKLPSNNRAI